MTKLTTTMTKMMKNTKKTTIDDDGDDKEDKYEEDDEYTSNKTDDNFGDAGALILEELHGVQNHNPQHDNLGSNFFGLTSHLALYYDPPLGPFSEYVGIFVQFILFEIIYILIHIFWHHFIHTNWCNYLFLYK